METKQVKGSSTIYGQAEIRLTKKTVQVKMDKRSGGKSYEVDRDEAPDNVQAGKWCVALNQDGTTLYSVRPISGTFLAKLEKFSAAEGADPVPVWETPTYKDKNGTRREGQPQQYFGVILRTREDYEYYVKFPYRFDETKEGNVTITYRKLGKRIENLLDFLKFAGVVDKPVPYSENILPTLEEMILDEDQEFLIKVENGWVTSFSEPLSPAKKSTRRKVSKKGK